MALPTVPALPMLLCAAALGLSLGAPAQAADALRFEAEAATIAGVEIRGLSAQIDLNGGARPQFTVSADSIAAGAAIGRFEHVQLICTQPQLDEPLLGCDAGRVSLQQGPLGAMAFPVRLQLRSDTGTLTGAARAIPLGDGKANVTVSQDPRAWSVGLQVAGASAQKLLPLAARFGVVVPQGISLESRIDGRAEARGRPGFVDRSAMQWRISAVNFSNDAGTVVGENVALSVSADARRTGARLEVIGNIESHDGQALAGPVLLDFKANPLTATLRGQWQDRTLDFDDVRIEQAALSRLRGQARLAFRGAGSTLVPTATLRIERLQMPAAYTSFLQIALAATDLGALRTSGTLTGLIEVRDDALSSIQLDLDGLDLVDTRGKFMLRDLRGRVHWTPAGAPAPPDSQLSWREGGAYGLSGGAAQIDFRTQGLAFALRKPTRVPVFDGAIAIRALTIDAIGTPKLALTFDGDIEPISMPRFASAFGWPEFAGQLAGRVPRVEFKDNVLTFGGDVEAQVFGGRIVANGLRLQDPLGSWPKLFADVRIERLDLALVTNTFSIGSITGRLDGALKGLELFNWSPVAFDAFLQTPAGDRSSHRISARAVGNLANIGGGGGGVRSALESGVFRMFDEYNYDRIGIRCRLANDVCTMSGIEPAGIGYFILKGRGVPHINIVGNAGRVNWPQLVSQIATQMRGEGKLRIE